MGHEMTTHEIRLTQSLEFLLDRHDFLLRVMESQNINVVPDEEESDDLQVCRYLVALSSVPPVRGGELQ